VAEHRVGSASAAARSSTAAASTPHLPASRRAPSRRAAGTRGAAGRAAARSPAGRPSPRRSPRSPCCCTGSRWASGSRGPRRLWAGSSAAPRGCGPRRRTCARCGTGRSPRRRRRGRGGVVGVSALARTRSRRSASAHSSRRRKACGGGRRRRALEQERRRTSLSCGDQRAGDHLAGGAVDRQLVALAEDLPAHPHLAGLARRRQVAGADDARLAEAAGDDRGVGGHAAARGDDARGGVHADDVLGGGLLAHQQHRALGLPSPPRGRRSARCGRRRRPGRPAAPWRGAARRPRPLLLLEVELRGEHLLEVLGLDPLPAPSAGRSGPPRPCRRRSAPPPGRCACRCGSAACRACRARW
jgi:hypothetical protein